MNDELKAFNKVSAFIHRSAFLLHRLDCFDLGFDGAECALEHFAVRAVGGAFELVEGACAREPEGFESFAAGAGFGRFVDGRGLGAARTLLRLLYLVFDRLALPTPRHLKLQTSFTERLAKPE